MCIWVTHRFDFRLRVNKWTLGFHHLGSGSRVVCKLVTPGIGAGLATGPKSLATAKTEPASSATGSCEGASSSADPRVDTTHEDSGENDNPRRDGDEEFSSGRPREKDEWLAELWATTNFPVGHGRQNRWMMEECKKLPNNYLRIVGKPTE